MENKATMGLNVGYISSNNAQVSKIDAEALNRVKEQIFNPSNDKSIDVSKLDLSKFNRVSLGTDLYAERTNGEVALKAAKAATDFGVNFSNAFSSQVQYLNSQAAQSLFTSKENSGKVVVGVDNTQPTLGTEAIIASAEIDNINNLDKNKKGHNPFVYYLNPSVNNPEDNDDDLLQRLANEVFELESNTFKETVNFLA
jgi:hypothetical protein